VWGRDAEFTERSRGGSQRSAACDSYVWYGGADDVPLNVEKGPTLRQSPLSEAFAWSAE